MRHTGNTYPGPSLVVRLAVARLAVARLAVARLAVARLAVARLATAGFLLCLMAPVTEVLLNVPGAMGSPGLASEVRRVTIDFDDGTKATFSPGAKWIEKPIEDSRGRRNILYLDGWVNDAGEIHTWYDPETGINHVFRGKAADQCKIRQINEYDDGQTREAEFTPPSLGIPGASIADGLSVDPSERFTLFPPLTSAWFEGGETDTSGEVAQSTPTRFRAAFKYPPDAVMGKIAYTVMDVSWEFIPPGDFERKKMSGPDVTYAGFAIPSSGLETFEDDRFPSKLKYRVMYAREEDRSQPDGPEGISQDLVASKTYSIQSEEMKIRVRDLDRPSKVNFTLPSKVSSGDPLDRLELKVTDNNPNLTVSNTGMNCRLTFNPPGVFEIPGNTGTSVIELGPGDVKAVEAKGEGKDPAKFFSMSTMFKDKPGRFPLYFRGILVPVAEVDDGFRNSTGEVEKPDNAVTVIDSRPPNLILEISTGPGGATFFPAKAGDSGPGSKSIEEASQRNENFSDDSPVWKFRATGPVVAEDTRVTFRIVAWDNIRRVQLKSDLPDCHVRSIEYSFDKGVTWTPVSLIPHSPQTHFVTASPFYRTWRDPEDNIEVWARVVDCADDDYGQTGLAQAGANNRVLRVSFDVVDTRQRSTGLRR